MRLQGKTALVTGSTRRIGLAYCVCIIRISLWETHRVYAIDVCRDKAPKVCPAGDEGKWVPLHRRLKIDEDEEDEEG